MGSLKDAVLRHRQQRERQQAFAQQQAQGDGEQPAPPTTSAPATATTAKASAPAAPTAPAAAATPAKSNGKPTDERGPRKCGHVEPIAVPPSADGAELQRCRQQHRAVKCKRCQGGKGKRHVCSICKEEGASHRLPNGAAYSTEFDAARGLWVGALHVGNQRWQAEHVGVFGLLRKLDRMYQQAQAAAEQPAVQ